jgi:hypothetical protein
MSLGRTREKEFANQLRKEDVNTIVCTLAFFNVRETLIYQRIVDLAGPAKFRVFDWLAMNLHREINEETGRRGEVTDDSNIWVAMGITYTHTSAVQQFVNSLRYNDYQLWEGKFTSSQFIDFLKAWDGDDVKVEKHLAEEAKNTLRR